PWQITRDPNVANFRVDSLRLSPGLEVDRLRDRRALFGQGGRQQKQFGGLAEWRRVADQQQQAVTMLALGKIPRDFEMDGERPALRDRYGRHSFGQSLLLARRLVEAGVPVVQANMGRVQNWDSHSDIFSSLKKRLLPPLDQAVAALLDDLEATGLL